MTSTYVTVSPALPSALHPSYPQCRPSTPTFSSWAQASLRAHPKDRGSTQGEGLLSDSLSSSEYPGDQGGHRSQPSPAWASWAEDSRPLGNPPCWQLCPKGIEHSLGSARFSS